MDLAIVILNWNGKKLLQEFLPSVVEYSQDFPIYIIDNHSTDDSVEYVQRNFSNIKIIRHSHNYGFTEGYNLGLQQINTDVYCLLNSDVQVTKNWISPVLELFKKDDSIAVIQPKILSYTNKEYFEYAGAGGGLIDKFGYPYCRGRIFENIEKDNGQYDDETEVFWASGACFFIRKSSFDSFSGFDADFFAHMEEIDLCWRLKNAGNKIFYTGKSTVYHLGGGTLNKTSSKKVYLNFRNNLLMLLKNLPQKSLFFILFTRMVLDGIAGIRFLFLGKFSYISAILKAHFYFYRNFSKFYRKRKQQPNKIPVYFHKNSILFNFQSKK